MLPLRSRLLVCALLVASALPAVAANTIVKLTTPVGTMTLELYDDAKPVTVANFLKYIRSGRFANSFAHRLPQGFVLQGGGFTVSSAGAINAIPTFGTVVNEAGPFPQYSNVAGTITMAKVADQPDSATSSWFINLKDNNTGTAEAGNLDLQNSGFTVFGRVIAGMEVVQRFAAFTNWTTGAATDTIVNYDNATLSNLPLKEFAGTGGILIKNLILTTWTIPGDAPAPAPAATVTAKPKAIGKDGRVTLKGSAANAVKVEVKAGKKAFKKAKGTPAKWTFTAQGLKPGKYKFQIRATNADGQATIKTVSVLMKD